jgi:anti-sigma B factor antagonist
MNVQIEDLGEVTCVRPEGRLDFGAAASFQESIERLFAGQSPPAVIIDGSALEYVSSAGLRAVLLAAKAAQRAGSAFALCALQPAVREVFALSGFSQIMAIHPDLETARSRVQAPQK